MITAASYLLEQECSNITLPCKVTSDNKTTVTYSWLHEDQYVNVDQRVYIDGSNLVISVAQSTDAGHYTCVVSTQMTDSPDTLPRVLHSNVSILSLSSKHVTIYVVLLV